MTRDLALKILKMPRMDRRRLLFALECLDHINARTLPKACRDVTDIQNRYNLTDEDIDAIRKLK